MASSTDNVKLGVCTVLFDGKDLGYTKGGVEVEVATTTHEVKVDQFGETPISELVTGRTVTVKTPLAETTLENLVAIMPGAQLISDGEKATGKIVIDTPPSVGDKITIAGKTFAFKVNPTAPTDVKISNTNVETAINLVEKINLSKIPFKATKGEDATVIVTATERGVAGNTTIDQVGKSMIITDPTGGVEPTKAAAVVYSGININLLTVAKELILRPLGTSGEDDFTVYRAACPGALNFAYQTDNERVYQADFKGYALEDGRLFSVGKEGNAE